MNFDLAKTPTIQAVTHANEQVLADDLKQRLNEALTQASADPTVTDADQTRAQADGHLESSRRAERSLSETARALGEKIAAAHDEGIAALIDAAAAGLAGDLKKVGALAGLEIHAKLVTKAIERLVEHVIPLSLVGLLRAESHAHLARSRALEAIAHARAESLLGKLQGAVADEVVLPIDLSKGVAGAILAQAADFKRRAIEASSNADRLEESYRQNNGRGQ